MSVKKTKKHINVRVLLALVKQVWMTLSHGKDQSKRKILEDIQE